MTKKAIKEKKVKPKFKKGDKAFFVHRVESDAILGLRTYSFSVVVVEDCKDGKVAFKIGDKVKNALETFFKTKIELKKFVDEFHSKGPVFDVAHKEEVEDNKSIN